MYVCVCGGGGIGGLGVREGAVIATDGPAHGIKLKLGELKYKILFNSNEFEKASTCF